MVPVTATVPAQVQVPSNQYQKKIKKKKEKKRKKRKSSSFESIRTDENIITSSSQSVSSNITSSESESSEKEPLQQKKKKKKRKKRKIKKLKSTRCKKHQKKNCKKCKKKLDKESEKTKKPPKKNFDHFWKKNDQKIKIIEQKLKEKKKNLKKTIKKKRKKRNKIRTKIKEYEKTKQRLHKQRLKMAIKKRDSLDKKIQKFVSAKKNYKKKKCKKHKRIKCKRCYQRYKIKISQHHNQFKKIEKKVSFEKKNIKKTKALVKPTFKPTKQSRKEKWTRICFFISINNSLLELGILKNLKSLIKKILEKGKIYVTIIFSFGKHFDSEHQIPFLKFTADLGKISFFLDEILDFIRNEKTKDSQAFIDQPNKNDWIGLYQTPTFPWGEEKNILIQINSNPSLSTSNGQIEIEKIFSQVSSEFIQKKIDYYFYRINSNLDDTLISFFDTIHKTQSRKKKNFMKIVDFVGAKQFAKEILLICKKSQFGKDALKLSPNNQLIQKQLGDIQSYSSDDSMYYQTESECRERNNGGWKEWQKAEVYVIDESRCNIDEMINKAKPAYFKHHDDKYFAITDFVYHTGKVRNIYYLCDEQNRHYVAKTWKDSTLTKNEKIQLCQKELAIQYLAKKLSGKFNEKRPFKSVDYLQQFIIIFPNLESDNVYVCEPFLDYDYQTFSDNMRENIDSIRCSSIFGYSHFTSKHTNNKIIITGSKGWHYREKSYLLTNPIIHSAKKMKKNNNEFSLFYLNPSKLFNDKDQGKKGIARFKKNHTCSIVCKKLKLKCFDKSNFNSDSTYRKFSYNIFCSNVYCGEVIELKNGNFQIHKKYYCTNCSKKKHLN
ncbi:eukaryotic elongation factor 2 kinase-related [Anaeramoeba flamelloides]|uniref:Eukaryotic elongation factor 2 kinase-related n=1 Tax=Anaeramoeba flamelloides TaxID=1746091 RepID=A0ABQ8YTJ1_9EUKA|nr:eukaryotic elongation factor 2 kinase-related [Anaeramoeba flamelloides]